MSKSEEEKSEEMTGNFCLLLACRRAIMNIRLGTVGFTAPAGREKDAKRYGVTMCGEMRKEDV